MALKLSACMDVVARMGPRDQDAVLAYLDDNEASGIPRDRAQLLAAESVLRDLLREQGEIQRSTARTVEVNGQRRPIENSEGQLIYPTTQGQINFWKWAGDTKVVDGMGRPLVVYHGTDQVIDRFKDGESGNGIFFAARPGAASAYALGPDADGETARDGANVVPVYLSIKNPLVVTDEWLADFEKRTKINYRMFSGDSFRDAFVDSEAYARDLVTEEARRLGHDGMILPADMLPEEIMGGDWAEQPAYAVFSPEQIKSATGNDGSFDAGNADITRSTARPIFYSQLEQAIAGVPDRLATMTAPQWKLWLDANTPKLGVKKDEIEWSGIGDYLKLRGKDKVTRDEIVGYLTDNGVKVQEVVLGSALTPEQQARYSELQRIGEDEMTSDQFDEYAALSAMAEDSGDATKYQKYTVPGGENYREVLITLPSKAPPAFEWTAESIRAKRDQFIGDMGFDTDSVDIALGYVDEAGSVDAALRMADARVGSGVYKRGTKEARDFLRGLSSGAKKKTETERKVDYKSSHWDQPNILVHLRVDDRTDADGKRVLFINEIQSDYAQEGRKRGFKPTPSELAQIEPGSPEAIAELARGGFGSMTATVDNGFGQPMQQTLAPASKDDRLPAAPFVRDTKSWVSLALKRAIVIAAQDDYDRVAMITGQQAADLYDLSKRVDMVSVSPAGDGRYDVTVNVIDGGKQMYRDKSPEEVADTIGKELAERAIAASNAWVEANAAYRAELRKDGSDEAELDRLRAARDAIETELTGEDLVVGGEGMRAFYNQIVPQVANDLLKKLGGGKVAEVDLANPDFGKEPFVNEHPDGFGYVVIDRESGLYYDNDVDGWRGAAPTPASKSLAEKWAKAIKQDGLKGYLRQPGFDITPAMREKLEGGAPLFSRGRTAGGASWDSPSASKFDDLVYKLQDKMVDAKRVVEAVRDTAGAIADDLNVYLQEELFHGRAAKRTEDFVNDELTPLVKQLEADGLKLADVEEFLHARHAKEANEVIAARNPGVADLQDGGSGMKTADAQQFLSTLDPALRAKLEAAATKVDAIIGKTRQLYVDYQLESQDTVDGWNKMFQSYIPLQREDKDGRGSPGMGQGFSVKGRETKGRTGSTRKVVDILANIAMQRERAIVRGEKNRVAQALVGLATANPNEGFWSVNDVPRERVFNPDTGVVEERSDPLYKNRENVVVAKVTQPDGTVKEAAVLFSEDDERALRMAAALKNLDAAQLEGLLGVSAKITRYFAAINTQYNPVFGIVNLVRDVQGAALNLNSTPLQGQSRRIAKDAFKAIAGIYADARAVRDGKHPASAWAKLWEEFQQVGGQTGYRDLFRTSAERAEAIEKALDPTAWMDSKLGKIFTANGTLRVPLEQAQKSAGFIFDWLSDYNLAMENGVRLAAYKAATERGMSKEQAASIAKNLTVNFNRKGQVGQQAGAVYAFFNASVQGTARIASTIFTMEPGKPKTIRLSKTGKTIVYGGLLLGSMQAMALTAAGFGEDDPAEFVRERSLVIPIGGKKYLTIPMPLGFHVIPSAGRIATEFALSGFERPQARAMQMLGILADSFNPIGNAGLSMQTLAPTALDPLVALTENRDWTGKPIARESSNRATPGHLLARDTASSLARALSEGINYASGGNQYVAGVLSPTPDSIDYLLGQVTGGVGRELSKVEQSALAIARGEELPTYKVPLAGRFFGDAKQQASEGNAFYANSERLNRLETEIKGLQKDGRQAEAQELRAANSEAYLIGMANTAERQLQKLRSEKRELVRAGAPREQVRALEDRITGVMSRLNRAVEAQRARGQ